MKRLLILLLVCFALNTPLDAVVESITIRWTTLLCQDACVKLLEREFRKIKGVDKISIDQGSGQASLTWKEKIPFEFTSINTAMHMVGLSIRNIRIKVSGTIRHTGDVFYIISEGDGTRFDLLNPIIPYPTGVAIEFNVSVRKITPALREKLLEGESLKQIATIEGPIFMPERMTVPTQIVVDHLDFKDRNDK